MHVSVLHPNLLNPHKRRTPKNSLEEAVSLANALDIEILHQTSCSIEKTQCGYSFWIRKVNRIISNI